MTNEVPNDNYYNYNDEVIRLFFYFFKFLFTYLFT